MSFEKPTTEIYFITVPFSSDYKNVIDFANKTEQETEFKKISGKHFINCNIIRKNRKIYIKEPFNTYYKYNYIMFRNNDYDNKWWYAFIIDSNYVGKGITEIDFEIDVWQTFQFDITYYRCVIERGIVPRTLEKAESTGITIDGYKNWTQSEPLNVDPKYSNEIDIFKSLSWTPYYCIESVSRAFNESGYLKDGFEYGGEGSGDSYSSVYSFPIGTVVDKNIYSNTVKAYGDINDHRSDLLNIRIIPSWLEFSSAWNVKGTDSDIYSTKWLNGNFLAKVEDSIKISSNKLANEYIPRNKKMLGSLARAFVIYNFNGLNIVFIPEVLNSEDTIKVSMEAKPIGMESIRLIINSIDNVNERNYDIPYNLTFDVAYNSNNGIQKMLGIFSASTQIARGVANVGVGIGGIITGGALGDLASSSIISATAGGVGDTQMRFLGDRYSYQSAKANQTGLSSASGIVGGLTDVFGGGVSLASALASKTGGTSSVADLNHYRKYNMLLHLGEYCPSKTDCKVIDQFLDMYGYTINESGMLNSWLKTRSNWNYVKTTNCNIKVKGSSTYEQILKNMFNNGVTIWHGFDVFGTYNSNRSDGVTINK